MPGTKCARSCSCVDCITLAGFYSRGSWHRLWRPCCVGPTLASVLAFIVVLVLASVLTYSVGVHRAGIRTSVRLAGVRVGIRRAGVRVGVRRAGVRAGVCPGAFVPLVGAGSVGASVVLVGTGAGAGGGICAGGVRAGGVGIGDNVGVSVVVVVLCWRRSHWCWWCWHWPVCCSSWR